MMAQPKRGKKKASLVTGCLLPIAGLVVFLAFCFGFCTVIFLVGNPAGNDTGSTGQILLWLLS